MSQRGETAAWPLQATIIQTGEVKEKKCFKTKGGFQELGGVPRLCGRITQAF